MVVKRNPEEILGLLTGLWVYPNFKTRLSETQRALPNRGRKRHLGCPWTTSRWDVELLLQTKIWHLRREWVKRWSVYLCPKHSEQRKCSGVFQGKDPPCLVLGVNSGGPFPVWGNGDFSHLEGVSCVLREEAWHQAPAWKTSSAEWSILQHSCKHHIFLPFRRMAEWAVQLPQGTAWWFSSRQQYQYQ